MKEQIDGGTLETASLRPPTAWGWQLVALTFVRLVLNTGVRIIYPFLPVFARGLQVSESAIVQLIAIRNVTGLLGAGFSISSERYGRRSAILGAAALMSIGAGCVALLPTYWGFGITLTLFGLAKVVYDPAVYAYVGDMVAYEQRGRSSAIIELAWALALLVGAPAAGWIIRYQGWQAPFGWLALLGGVGTLSLWWLLPRRNDAQIGGTDWKQILAVVWQHPVIWAVFAYTGLLMVASEQLLIVYGPWLEQDFSPTVDQFRVGSWGDWVGRDYWRRGGWLDC